MNLNFQNFIKNEFIKIKNYVDNGEIHINGDIGDSIFTIGYTFDDFKWDLKQIKGDIIININSFGGNLFEAMSIYDHIRSLPNKVTTQIVGSSASAATIISLAGDKRLISQNSRYLIHKPMIGVVGNSDDFEAALGQLKEIDKQVIDLYVERTNLTYDEVLTLMREEKFISSGDAITMGFCDQVIEDKSKNETNKNETIMSTKKNETTNKKEVSAKVSKKITDTVDTQVVNAVNEEDEEIIEDPIEEEVSNEEEVEEDEVVNEEDKEDEPMNEDEDEEEDIDALKARIKALEEENEELRAEKEVEEAENVANEVTNFINEAISNGFIMESARDEWTNLGIEQGVNVIRTLINSIPATPKNDQKLKNIVKPQAIKDGADMLNKWKRGEITSKEYLNFVKVLKTKK